MPFATWWRGDSVPDLGALPGFAARPETDRVLIRQVTGQPAPTVEARLGSGNDLFVATLDGKPVGYGWLAHRCGGIDELDFSFGLPAGDAYLWDFATLPNWRGLGVYPHLLQAIVRHASGVERFWIGYEARNLASARGIQKAGFRVIGDLEVTGGRVSGFAVDEPGERAVAARAIFHPRPHPTSEQHPRP
jgi:GNAT superfamily N-acetyltransferase